MAMAVSTIAVPSIGRAYDDTDLVHVYTLDESSGTREDSVGTSDLTDTNTVGSHTTTCMDAGCADFARANSEYLVTTADLITSNEFTISFWARLDSVPGSGQNYGYYTFCDATNSRRYSIEYLNYQGSYYINDGMDSKLKTLSNNTWYHFATTRTSGGVVSTWVNGVIEMVYTESTVTVNAERNVLGDSINCSNGSSYSRYHNGDIDEFYVFDTAFSTTSIEALYASGVGDFYPFGGGTSTTSTSTATSTSLTTDELIWVLELYLSLFTFLIFTYVGYRFTKLFL